MNKTALITGITGQDGSFLAELLLEKGYNVHGIIRRSSSFNTGKIDHIFDRLSLHYGDMTDSLSIDNIIHKVKPDEVYHLAAQSHVAVSFDIPKYTGEVDALGTLYMLEAIKKHAPGCKFYNATTSELYGKVQETPQNEDTKFYPRSPYGVAKLYSYWITKNYRESYKMFAVNGILFNHESERRGSTFVTKKIVEGLAKYLQDKTPIYLGNLDAKRDWGYAPEYVEGMWRMLQQEEPEDFVLATGETHSIREFIDECVHVINENQPKGHKLSWGWQSDDHDRDILINALYSSVEEGRMIIGINEKYYRPADVELLLGDASKAKEKLGWEPKVKFEELAKKMMLNELEKMNPNEKR